MKKTLLLSVALGLASAATLSAATVEVFLTGSTAFRANAYVAATKLYVGGTPTIYYGDAAHGGANSGFSSSTASWVMTGTPITQLTNISGNTLVIHGLFTGSIQGIQTVEQSVPLVFAAPAGTVNGLCSSYVTNTPTVAFSDASGDVTPFKATGNYVEEPVAVLPFIYCKANSMGVMTNVNNISWEQATYGIPQGRIPLSAWTTKISDTNTFVYMAQRTKDSGTRRTETACQYFQYNDPVTVYIWDSTNKFWFAPTTLAANALGTFPNGVVGPAGLNGVNVSANWGYGYVGGGDLRAALNDINVTNSSIGFISFSDGKTCGSSNWATMVSFNGMWPTVDGGAQRGKGGTGNSGTNDFSPITLGYYPLWSQLALVHPVDTSLIADSKITTFQLGDYVTPGSFMGVFNAQTLINGGSPLTGSIENEIELSKANGATAIRLSEMKSNRSSVGATITPF